MAFIDAVDWVDLADRNEKDIKRKRERIKSLEKLLEQKNVKNER